MARITILRLISAEDDALTVRVVAEHIAAWRRVKMPTGVMRTRLGIAGGGEVDVLESPEHIEQMLTSIRDA